MTKEIIEQVLKFRDDWNWKVKKNAEKYPVEKAYGYKEKYTELGE